MEALPTAFYLAPLEHVIQNPYVLFRLVRPTPPTKLQKSGGVESAAGLVNVIPQRRIYRMETVDEIEIFKRELLKRPLVLQCISHSGLGCGSGAMGCSVRSVDKNWVLLINQTHPKVLGRLQMGADAAKHAMQKGNPFILRFRFGDLLQRLHKELFQNDATLSSTLQYTEWEYAELVIRFPGKVGASKMTVATSFIAPNCRELNFDFADIDIQEIKQAVNNHTMVLRGPIPPVTPDEITELLPEWTINEITPLDAIGEERPDTYNYAQAGRLYESFRKKKKQRARSDDEKSEVARPNTGMRMRSLPGGPVDDGIPIDDVETSFMDDGGFGAARNGPSEAPVKPQRKSRAIYNDNGRDYLSGKSHVYPDVTVIDSRDRTPSTDSRDYYDLANRAPGAPRTPRTPRTPNQFQPTDNRDYDSVYNRATGTPRSFDQTRNRESDRSSNSAGESSATGADSGYSGDDGYGYHGNRRQNGYDQRHYENGGQLKTGHHYSNLDDKYGRTSTQRAQENLGFNVDDHRQDDILQKHKEHVAKMLHNHGATRNDYNGYQDTGYTRNGNYGNPRDDVSPRGYYGDRSRGYNDSADQLPTYRDVTSPSASGQFHIQEKEAVSESFI